MLLLTEAGGALAGHGRRRFNAAIQARVALEARREPKIVAQIAGEFACHPSQVVQWKTEAVEGRAAFFVRPRGERSSERWSTNLDEQSGRLTREGAWFKTKFGASASPAGELGRTRGPLERDTPLHLVLTRLLAEPCTRTPCAGSRRLTVWLRRLGSAVHRRRGPRLMSLMGLEASYPRPPRSQGVSTPEKSPDWLGAREVIAGIGDSFQV